MKGAARHLPAVGGLTLGLGALAAIGGLQALVRGVAHGLLAVAAAGFLLYGLLGAWAGFALLRRRASGILPTQVFAAVSLIGVPVGTAYGLYAFAVLCEPDAKAALA